MNDYLINTSLGYFIVAERNERRAWVQYVTSDTPIENCCLDQQDLLHRGYTTLEPTDFKNVFLLNKSPNNHD